MFLLVCFRLWPNIEELVLGVDFLAHVSAPMGRDPHRAVLNLPTELVARPQRRAVTPRPTSRTSKRIHHSVRFDLVVDFDIPHRALPFLRRGCDGGAIGGCAGGATKVSPTSIARRIAVSGNLIGHGPKVGDGVVADGGD